MKSIHLLSILTFCTLFFLTCREYTIDYTIYCSLPSRWSDMAKKGKLIITTQDNEVLQTIDIANQHDDPRIIQSFTLNLGKPVETFNIHYISETYEDYTLIFSHIGAKNNGEYHFWPNLDIPIFPPNDRVAVFNFDPIPDLNKIQIKGDRLHPQATPNGTGMANLANEEGIVLTKYFSDKSPYKMAYIPWNEIKDTMLIQEQAFKAPTKYIDFTLQCSESVANKVETWLVSPDFKHYAQLSKKKFYEQNLSYRIYYPENIPSDWLMYFIAFNGQPTIEKTCKLSDKKIHLSPYATIKNVEYADHHLSVKYEGEGDWITLNTAYEKETHPNKFMYWRIEGHPKQFDRLELPDLSPYLGNKAASYKELFKSYSANIVYSGQHDYDDMRYGIPWKFNNLFEKGRKGYSSIYFNK